MIIGLLFAIARFVPGFFMLVISKSVVMVTAPIIALPPFVRFAEESETTGYPSQWPGKKRAFLVPWLMWAQTHDDCLDAFWTAKRYGRWIDRYDQAYFDSHWWLRYYCYVAWLWRNPAYGVAHRLGFDQRGVVIIRHRDDGVWNQPVNDVSYWIVRNARRQYAFELRIQWYYGTKRYFQLRLGWGVFRTSPVNRGMLYARIIPFKKVS